jgi:hypothetical protein
MPVFSGGQEEVLMDRCQLRACLKQRWIWTLILVLASGTVSLADEIVPIGKILANAPSLADHLVTFRGLVVSLERLPPLGYRQVLSQNCFMQNRYMAVIEDDTGSINAIVCGMPLDEKGRIARGDEVVIRAVLNKVPGEGFLSDILANTVRMERAIEVDK